MYIIGMNVFWQIRLVRAYMFPLCMSSVVVKTHGFVWKFLSAIYNILVIN